MEMQESQATLAGPGQFPRSEKNHAGAFPFLGGTSHFRVRHSDAFLSLRLGGRLTARRSPPACAGGEDRAGTFYLRRSILAAIPPP